MFGELNDEVKEIARSKLQFQQWLEKLENHIITAKITISYNEGKNYSIASYKNAEQIWLSLKSIKKLILKQNKRAINSESSIEKEVKVCKRALMMKIIIKIEVKNDSRWYFYISDTIKYLSKFL